ncbi:bilin-binding protein-like [Panonychus citri]|uniref:bilin-binding protein-like n=1 Tax=Panonychus citri TaxID=50023 RepID=UPI0023080B5F|nr:bilin-binding protein-like [Panonychus citri]
MIPLSLIVSVLIGSAFSYVTLPGPCPQVPTIENFSWAKVSGSWFAIKSTSDVNGEYDYCPIVKLFMQNNLTISYVEQFGIQGYLRGQGGPGKIDSKQSNKLSVKFLPHDPSFDRYIVKTDYKNFVTIYGCESYGENHRAYGRIATITKTPSAEVKLAGYLALQSLGLPITSLINSDFTNCNFS